MVNRFHTFLLAVFVMFLSGCGSKDSLVLLKPEDTEVWRTTGASPGSAVEAGTRLVVKTNFGNFEIELYDKEAPISVANFLSYVDTGFYNGTLFHRVIPGFMVQGGGFTEGLERKETGDPIENEAGNGLRNIRGTLALARTNNVDSATSQFFVNLVNNGFLNGDGETSGYAVFGRVSSGMDVVDRIAGVPTREQNGMGDVPVEPVIIESIERL